jgi:hypothetical protein
MATRSFPRTSKIDCREFFHHGFSILLVSPIFVAIGALIGAVLFMALSMANLLPDGINATLEGLFLALGLAGIAMACDRLALRFKVDLRNIPTALRAIRNAIFIAAFALGFVLPALSDLLARS